MRLIACNDDIQGTTLEREIFKVKEDLDSVEAVINVLYDGLMNDLIPKESKFAEQIRNTPKTSYSFPEFYRLISEYYLSDTQGEFLKPEFESVQVGIAIGLVEYYDYRVAECPSDWTFVPEEDLTDSLYRSVKRLYRDPNDFVIEYEQFNSWHGVDANIDKEGKQIEELKSKSLSYWMDALFFHSRLYSYLKTLEEAKENINFLSEGRDFEFRRKIVIEMNSELNK